MPIGAGLCGRGGCSSLRRRYAQDLPCQDSASSVAKGDLSELLCLSGARQKSCQKWTRTATTGWRADPFRPAGVQPPPGAVLLASGPVDGVFAPDGRRWGDPQRPQHNEPPYRDGCMLNVHRRLFFGGKGAGGSPAVAAAASWASASGRPERPVGWEVCAPLLLDAAYTLIRKNWTIGRQCAFSKRIETYEP